MDLIKEAVRILSEAGSSVTSLPLRFPLIPIEKKLLEDAFGKIEVVKRSSGFSEISTSGPKLDGKNKGSGRTVIGFFKIYGTIEEIVAEIDLLEWLGSGKAPKSSSKQMNRIKDSKDFFHGGDPTGRELKDAIKWCVDQFDDAVDSLG